MTKEKPDRIIAHTPTLEIWTRAQAFLFKEGYVWSDDSGPKPLIHLRMSYGGETCITVNSFTFTLTYASRGFYREMYPNIPIITYDELVNIFGLLKCKDIKYYQRRLLL